MMPKPSIWMIRLSLINLLIAAIFGGLILAHKAIGIHPAIWSFLPLHYELAIWGWMAQFVMGMAYWMFPKMLRENRRGPETPAWFMILIFNAGLFILAVSPFFQSPLSSPLIGRAFIAISILTFALLIWPRVVTYRNLG